MRLRNLLAAFLVAGAVLSSSSMAAKLNVGDPAPPITVSKWVKGEPVKELEKGKLYVVEFWATWCGPCKETIPHLTEMAKANPEVTFIGASVWENNDAAVEPFVAKMGQSMDYHVAMDDKSTSTRGAMADNWMTAADQNGIPAAFIVDKEGKVAWIGHPMEMEPVLKQVIAGQWDMDKAKKLAAEQAAMQEQATKLQSELGEKVSPLLQKGDYLGAAAAIDEMIVAHPDAKPMLTNAKFSILLRGEKYDEAFVAADQLAEINKDNAQALNALAWFIVDDKSVKTRDLDRALKYATAAADASGHKDAAILDTLARVHFEKNDIAKAIEIQTKAVQLADESLKADLQQALDKYTAAKK